MTFQPIIMIGFSRKNFEKNEVEKHDLGFSLRISLRAIFSLFSLREMCQKLRQILENQF